MRKWLGVLALCALAFVAEAQTFGHVFTQYVDFPKGYQGRTYIRTIKGLDVIDYLIRNVEEQQKFEITITSKDDVSCFDVYDPNGKNPRFTGSKDGGHFTGRFAQGGTVRVRVYLRYDAAGRGETSNYNLTIVPGGVPPR